jgi:hypothetical protein
MPWAVAEPRNDAPRRIRLRYPAVCAGCGIALSPGAEAYWNSATKEAICLACGPDTPTPEAGTAGASAAAEGERRKEKRVDKARREYGDYAANVAEEMAGADVAASWGKGSEGESELAEYVRRELGDAVIPLHDRLIPGTRGNIDHIFVAPTGVWVVDAKAYTGKLVKRETGPIWRRANEVFVGGRNRTALVKGVERQVAAVVAALRPDPALKGTDVHAALCFVGSEWGLLDAAFQIGNVWVMRRSALRKRLKKSGPLSRETMERIAHRLALSLPPASGASSDSRGTNHG